MDSNNTKTAFYYRKVRFSCSISGQMNWEIPTDVEKGRMILLIYVSSKQIQTLFVGRGDVFGN